MKIIDHVNDDDTLFIPVSCHDMILTSCPDILSCPFSDDVIGKIVGEIEALGCGIPENFFQCQQDSGDYKVHIARAVTGGVYVCISICFLFVCIHFPLIRCAGCDVAPNSELSVWYRGIWADSLSLEAGMRSTCRPLFFSKTTSPTRMN